MTAILSESRERRRRIPLQRYDRLALARLRLVKVPLDFAYLQARVFPR